MQTYVNNVFMSDSFSLSGTQSAQSQPTGTHAPVPPCPSPGVRLLTGLRGPADYGRNPLQQEKIDRCVRST